MRLIRFLVCLTTITLSFSITGCGVPYSTYLYKPKVTNQQISQALKDCRIRSLNASQRNNQIVNSVTEGFAKDLTNSQSEENWVYGCMYEKGYELYTEDWMKKHVKNWDQKFYDDHQKGFFHKELWSVDLDKYRKLGIFNE